MLVKVQIGKELAPDNILKKHNGISSRHQLQVRGAYLAGQELLVCTGGYLAAGNRRIVKV